MILRIADFFIEAKVLYPQTQDFCRAYCVEKAEHIDFSVEVNESDVQYERDLASAEGMAYSMQACEPFALYRKICAECLCRDAFLMHGAVIEYQGKGYLFTAKSGVGKTTHILLWKKRFGDDKVTIVNGDKPILRIQDGRIRAYGTPWCGKEGFQTNTGVFLNGLCFVERDAQNHIEHISAETAFPKLFSQVMIADSADLPKQLDLLNVLLERVPMYTLYCNTNIEAAEVAYAGLQGGME